MVGEEAKSFAPRGGAALTAIAGRPARRWKEAGASGGRGGPDPTRPDPTLPPRAGGGRSLLGEGAVVMCVAAGKEGRGRHTG